MRETVRFVIAALLTLVYAFALMGHQWGAGFTFFNTVMVVMLLAYPQRRSPLNLIFGAASILLSVFMALHSYWLAWFLTIVATWVLNTLIASNALAGLTRKSLLLIPIATIGFTVGEILAVIPWILGIVGKLVIGRRYSSVAPFVRGFLIGIPVLLFLLVLFVSADPLFEKYAGDVFNWIRFDININLEWIPHAIELTIVFGMMASLLRRREYSFGEFSLLEKFSQGVKELLTVSTLISIMIALFLFVQAQYLFASQDLLKEMGVMLSEYTRRGYAELLIASGLVVVIVSHLIRRSVKLMSLFLLTEVILLLASATRRVYLYQNQFGFTEIRLLGFLISIWLLGMIIYLVGRTFQRWAHIEMGQVFLCLSVVALLLMHLINVDYQVGVVKQPNLGYGVDYEYISGLSTDAWPAWEQMIRYTEVEAPCDTAAGNYTDHDLISYTLSNKYSSLEYQSENHWYWGGAWIKADADAWNYMKNQRDRINNLEETYDKRCKH